MENLKNEIIDNYNFAVLNNFEDFTIDITNNENTICSIWSENNDLELFKCDILSFSYLSIDNLINDLLDYFIINDYDDLSVSIS